MKKYLLSSAPQVIYTPQALPNMDFLAMEKLANTSLQQVDLDMPIVPNSRVVASLSKVKPMPLQLRGVQPLWEGVWILLEK